MSPGFAAILFAALLLAALLSYLQHRAYSGATQRLARQFSGQRDAVIVSGRGKGWTRGAVVLLVVNSNSRKIMAAQTMTGASVLARFHDAPELIGGLKSAGSRTEDVRVKEALVQATEQYKTVIANRRTA